MLAKFHRIEFEAVDGRIRTTYGCSVVGAIEFDERLHELQLALETHPKEISPETLYRKDKWVRHLIDRCLELNGIDSSWVNWDMVSQLLLGRAIDGQTRKGYLVELNQPDRAKQSHGSESGPTSKAALIAAISTHCQGLEEAYRIANTVPAHELIEVLRQKNELAKPLEQRLKEKKDADFEAWKQKKLQKIKGGQRATG